MRADHFRRDLLGELKLGRRSGGRDRCRRAGQLEVVQGTGHDEPIGDRRVMGLVVVLMPGSESVPLLSGMRAVMDGGRVECRVVRRVWRARADSNCRPAV